jgi:hypothetical protein
MEEIKIKKTQYKKKEVRNTTSIKEGIGKEIIENVPLSLSSYRIRD